jgi:hypothetical protein
MITKICTCCKEEKYIYDFGSRKKTKDGLRNECKKCANLQSKLSKEKNKEKVSEREKQYRLNSRDKKAEYYKKYKEENKEKIDKKNKIYAENNKEKIKESQKKYKEKNKERIKEYRLKNKELILEKSKEYRENNKEKESERIKEWRLKNKDRVRLKNREWRLNNLHVMRINEQNRRSRKKFNGGKLSKGIIEKLYNEQKGLCACCGESLENGYHLDHIIPLTMGGSHSDDNAQLLTPHCNLSKGCKHPDEYIKFKLRNINE